MEKQCILAWDQQLTRCLLIRLPYEMLFFGASHTKTKKGGV